MGVGRHFDFVRRSSRWVLHARRSPDNAAGGLMIPLFAGTLHGFGLRVVAGGAGRFVTAFHSLLVSLGVHVETSF
jgi:phytoene dehydrogenase-like protein